MKTIIQLVTLAAGCVVLFLIGHELIADNSVPSLGEFIASSTEEMSSSTADISSSAQTVPGSTSSSETASTNSTAGGSITSAQAEAMAAALLVTDLRAPKGVIHVMVADTEGSREQGLSDLPSLPINHGMLFAFDSPGSYAFWMKDMLFSLDMVWISSDGTVAGVTPNLSPDTFPATFSPPSPVSYVLEIDAGSAASFGLVPGAKTSFVLPKNK